MKSLIIFFLLITHANANQGIQKRELHITASSRVKSYTDGYAIRGAQPSFVAFSILFDQDNNPQDVIVFPSTQLHGSPELNSESRILLNACSTRHGLTYCKIPDGLFTATAVFDTEELKASDLVNTSQWWNKFSTGRPNTAHGLYFTLKSWPGSYSGIGYWIEEPSEHRAMAEEAKARPQSKFRTFLRSCREWLG